MNLNAAARAVGLVAGLTLATNVLGFLRELLMARAFGTGAAADAFVSAFTIVSTCFLIFTAGTVQAAFMPVYQRLIAESRPEQARGLFWRSIGWLAAVLLVCAGLVYGTAGSIVTFIVPGFDVDRKQLTIELTRVLAPLIVLAGAAVLLQSVSHAHRQFIGPALVPALGNLVVIAALIVFGVSADVVPVAWAYVAGGLLWWFILVPSTHGYLAGPSDLSNRDAFRAAVAGLGPLIVLLIADQASALLQKRFVSDLEPGSIAALNYAYKLEGLPVGIFAAAIATVFFPSLIDALARGDRREAAGAFRDGMLGIVHIAMPATLLLFVKSELVVRVLFERGAFDARATGLTARALEFYALGLVAQSLIVFLNRVFFAARDTLTPMRIGVTAAGLHILLAWFAVKLIGYVGIALATTAYAFIYAGWLALRLERVIGVSAFVLFKVSWRAGIAAVGCGFALVVFPSEGSWIALTLAAVTATIVYVGFLAALRDPIVMRLTRGGGRDRRAREGR